MRGGERCRDEGGILKGHEQTIGGGKLVHDLDCGDDLADAQ